MKGFWLVKSEGDCYSIDDLARDGETAWEGVRNFQARNFMREMHVGDSVLFYHSSSKPSGVYGLARVSGEIHADESAFDSKDEHFDPRSTPDKPLWECVDIAFVSKFTRPVSIDELRLRPELSGMEILRKGSRLSVTPVSKKEYEVIARIGGK